MKKLLVILFVVLASVGFSINSQAADNFLYFRIESGEKVSGSENFQGTYTVFENNGMEGVSLGTKIITGENGYNKLNPYAYKHLIYGLQLGVKYSEDSLRNEAFGASIRFKGNVGKVFMIFDYTREFDPKNGTAGKNDSWLYLTSTNPNFNFGAEVWYYNFLGGDKYLHLRPIRLSYKYESMNFFIMPNFCWQDGKLTSRSVMTGIEAKF